ncbi:MAG: hypothetical protein J6J42_07310 [Lachnospiraceae bacterium]|nr:hypothetical protein [Lachnospiraceae bacterium]
MSFLTNLNVKCMEYTQFTYNGMSIKIPYRLKGKATPEEMREAISAWAGTQSKTQAEVQEYVSANKKIFGLDCSGFVYYVLNEATGGAVREYFEAKKGGTLSYAYGILASELSNIDYGTKITMAKDIKPGCTIQVKKGAHVMVVHSVNKNAEGVVTSIVYAHSDDVGASHHGYINIGDETKDLNHASQTWRDTAYTNPAYLQTVYTHTVLLKPVQDFV